jgi:hypothetical protein
MPNVRTRKKPAPSTKAVRITQANILKGVRHSEIKGKHRQERHVNVVGSNVKPLGMLSKNKKLLVDSELDISTGSPIDPKRTAHNEFMARSSDMRGKQTSTVFRGQRVYNWSPERDFRPDAVGYVQGGGAFAGGFVNEALAKKARSGYFRPMGHAKRGVSHGGEGLRNVNPFSINLRVKPADL